EHTGARRARGLSRPGHALRRCRFLDDDGVTNGSLAQGVLARFSASWRPSPDLAALSLPMWIPVPLALAAAATSLGGTARFLGINVMIVLAVPFCLAGLVVLHIVVRRLPDTTIPLVAFYVLALLFGLPLLLVAPFGVARFARA